MSPVEEKPNVFAFMEEDEDGEKAAEQLDSADVPEDHSTQATLTNSHYLRSGSVPDRVYRLPRSEYQSSKDTRHQPWDESPVPPLSHYSDSGISVRSSSPERDSPVMRHKFLSNRAYRKSFKENSVDPSQSPLISTYVSRPASPRISNASSYSADMSPEAYYSADPRFESQHTRSGPPYEYVPPHQGPNAFSTTVNGRALQKQSHEPSEELKRSGYDLLACSISSHSHTELKPIYRKFENLHNRMLLHLQDEISELEGDLQAVDRLIADDAKYSGLKKASRRAEAKMPSQLQWHRMEIMGRIFVKLEQYSRLLFRCLGSKTDLVLLDRALSTYSSLSQSIDTASSEDIKVYKDWITKHAPVIDAEAAFLDHTSDLAAITARKSVKLDPPETSAMASGFAVLLTIIAFKMVPQFCSRLVIGAIVGIAMVYSGTSPAALSVGSFHDYTKCASM